MNLKIVIAFLFVVFGPVWAMAQTPTWRMKQLLLSTDSTVIDSLSIVPNSFKVTEFDTSYYEVDIVRSVLVWKSSTRPDSIEVSYRVFPFSFSKDHFNKDIRNLQPEEKAVVNPFKYTKVPVNSKGLFFGGLNKKGSIARGISFGNNQNLGVTSNLNLQMSGRITDRINILASISGSKYPCSA